MALAVIGPRDAAARRRGAGLVLATLLVASTTAGCYSNRALLGPPDPGTQVQARLNDRGRQALADSLGHDPEVVEGRVTARTDSTFTIAVSRVRLFSGESSKWLGEPITLRMSSLRALDAHQLARGPTVALVVAGAALVFVLLRAAGVTGGGSGGVPSGSGVTPPPSGT